ncbi:MAG: SRPBCC family protein [Tahibacter sp.]
MRCTAQAAFDFALDTAQFPATFTGYGPIPSIRSIVVEGPLMPGAVRRVSNSDGSVLTERVETVARPERHSYTLEGFRVPFSWLVRQGTADWTFEETGVITRVRWTYAFRLTSPLVMPLAMVLLRLFMTRAMQRCLENMAGVLDDGSGAMRGHA